MILIAIKLMCELFHNFDMINYWLNNVTKVVEMEPARHISHFQLFFKKY